jgi:hypothetical protein
MVRRAHGRSFVTFLEPLSDSSFRPAGIDGSYYVSKGARLEGFNASHVLEKIMISRKLRTSFCSAAIPTIFPMRSVAFTVNEITKGT